MSKKIQLLSSILITALLFANPFLVLGQEPLEEMPPLVYDQSPMEENSSSLPIVKPLVRIQTVGIIGRTISSHDYASIGELTGFGDLRVDDRAVQNGRLHNGSHVQVG